MISHRTFAFAFGEFGILLLVQLLLWRPFKIKKQMLWLFVIFLFVPIVSIAWLRDQADLAAGAFLALCISAAYVQTFPAAQARSPSLVILNLIAGGGPDGMAREELLSRMSASGLLEDRIQDLGNDGLISTEDGKVRLRGPGRLLAAVFFYYRRVLNLPRGMG